MRTKDELMMAYIAINKLPDDETVKGQKRQQLLLEVLLDIRENLSAKILTSELKSLNRKDDADEESEELEKSFFKNNPFAGA